MEYVSITETLRLRKRFEETKGDNQSPYKSQTDRQYTDENKNDKPLSMKLYTEN